MARQGNSMGAAWAQHAMCESAFRRPKPIYITAFHLRLMLVIGNNNLLSLPCLKNESLLAGIIMHSMQKKKSVSGSLNPPGCHIML
jgi:hypothetical protein